MLRTLIPRSRGVLPTHILELIVASSTSTPTRRPYNVYRQPLGPNVESASSSDMLSRLSVLIRSDQEAKLTDEEAELYNRRLSSLRLALGNRDLVSVRDAYEDLVKHSSTEALMARDFEAISRMLDRHFSECLNVQDAMVGIPEMAVEVAARGHIGGLRACLLLHLRSGNIPGLLSIYANFELLTRGANSPGSEQPPIRQQSNSTDSEAISKGMSLSDPVERKSNGMADLVLIMVVAYATENRFNDAFDLFLATPMAVRVSATKVRTFCGTHLSHDPSLSEKVRMWIHELILLRLVFRESTLNNHISRLGNEKQIVPLERLYASVISECKRVDGRLVVELTSSRQKAGGGDAERRVVCMSSDGWSTFMQAFFKCHRADLVERLWNDVGELGLSPNRRMWAALLDGYGRHGHCEKAMLVWNRMLDEGVEPDEISYGAMVSAYFHAQRPNEGFALFEQFRRGLSETAKGRQTLAAPAMLPLFNIVLHGLCTNAMDDRARSVLKEMVEQGPKPDIVSYNTFLRHYGRIGDMKGLAGVLRALKPAGVQPDVHSFTTVLSALYRAGKRDAHTKTIEIMHTMGVEPNVAMYSAIIDFLVRQGGEDNFRRAYDLLLLMEKNPNKDCRPNEVTYTGFLAGLHRDRSISAQNVEVYTADLLGRMHKNGKLPNRTTYHILIKACLENLETGGLETALGYYREMEKRGIKLLNDTWYVILAGLLRREDLAMAGEILNEMFKKGHEPDSALATLVGRVQREIAFGNGGGDI